VYYVTVTFTNLLTFNGDFSFGKKKQVVGSHIWTVGVLTALGDAMICQKKSCTVAVEWAGALM
jgi:hypothetical protein